MRETPALPPWLQDAQSQFFKYIDAEASAHWKMGDLANRLEGNWRHDGPFKSLREFYEQVIKPQRPQTAPSYPSLTLYSRIAAHWPETAMTRIGPKKLGAVWSWCTFHQLDYPQDLSALPIPIGGGVTKTAADATAQEILDALAKERHPPTPLSARVTKLRAICERVLEAHQQHGTAHLKVIGGSPFARLSLVSIDEDHFVETIRALAAGLDGL